MRKILSCILIVLLSALMMPITAFSAFNYSVDFLDVTAELNADSGAVINETWTVTFNGESDGFTREIMIPEDNFETFSSVSDISVSVDGHGCSFLEDEATDGTYSVTKTESSYVIRWYQRSLNETHKFSIRYVLNSAVKIYRDEAYFYCTVVNGDSGLVCRNVSVTVTAPAKSYAEQFRIIESGSLAGKKADGTVVFSADNTAGEVKVGLTMPVGIFDAQKLPVISDDYTAEILILAIPAVILIVLAAYLIYYGLNYRRLFRRKWEKKCRKNIFDEASYSAYGELFKKLSPSCVLDIITDEAVSECDRFLVNLLELIRRGYITVTNEGFIVSEESECDDCGRPFDKKDMFVMKVFGDDSWSRMIEAPEGFYNAVSEYNRMSGFVSPGLIFSARGRKFIARCFEMKLSAGRYEFISPAEISDDFFRNRKYSMADMIISLLNEHSLIKKNAEMPDTERFKYNMFMLREVYEKGKNISLVKEIELQRAKGKK